MWSRTPEYSIMSRVRVSYHRLALSTQQYLLTGISQSCVCIRNAYTFIPCLRMSVIGEASSLEHYHRFIQWFKAE